VLFRIMRVAEDRVRWWCDGQAGEQEFDHAGLLTSSPTTPWRSSSG
jgi:hypothetical protein